MSKRETGAVAQILTDPENANRSAEEVADLVLDRVYVLAVARAKAEVRDDTRREIYDKDSEARRLAVVGQIQFEAQERPHTVILGPFTARGILDSPEKFLKAVQGGTAARGAAEGLAWDSKTGTGRGRFTLAPAFMRPRDAWDYFRQPQPPDPRLLRITETIQRWEAGKWAREASDGPSCVCGLSAAPACPRHPAV